MLRWIVGHIAAFRPYRSKVWLCLIILFGLVDRSMVIKQCQLIQYERYRVPTGPWRKDISSVLFDLIPRTSEWWTSTRWLASRSTQVWTIFARIIGSSSQLWWLPEGRKPGKGDQGGGVERGGWGGKKHSWPHWENGTGSSQPLLTVVLK